MAKAMTRLKQIVGGDTIKKGDTSSIFTFELQDSDGQKMAITGTGRLILENDTILAMHKDVEVVDRQFSFTLDEDTPSGTYLLELDVNGYVFPVEKFKVRIRKAFTASGLVPPHNDPKMKALAEELKKSGYLASGDTDDLPDLVALYNISKI